MPKRLDLIMGIEDADKPYKTPAGEPFGCDWLDSGKDVDITALRQHICISAIGYLVDNGHIKKDA